MGKQLFKISGQLLAFALEQTVAPLGILKRLVSTSYQYTAVGGSSEIQIRTGSFPNQGIFVSQGFSSIGFADEGIGRM